MRKLNNLIKVFITFVIISVSSVAVYADSLDLGKYVPSNNITINDIEYLLRDNGEAEIIWAEKTVHGDIVIPPYVTKNGKQYKVTKIGANVFSLNEQITSIILPQTLIEIENCAFMQCVNLETIVMPNTLSKMGDCFHNCKKLKSIVLPEGIEDIEARTFDNCRRLKSITIPKSVKRIRDNAFSACVELKEIILLNPDTRINEKAFGTLNVNIINWNGRTCKPRVESIRMIVNGKKVTKGIKNPDED